MHSNQYGQVIRTEKEVFDLLYQNPNLDLNTINFDSASLVDKFNQASSNCGLDLKIHTVHNIETPIEEFDRKNQQDWFFPGEKYCPNLFDMLYSMCDTEEQKARLNLELELYIKHDMIELLHYLKYLIDLMREKGIIWGVGRGSSVASYVLFLIGVHKIDSLKYNLDIGEFLK